MWAHFVSVWLLCEEQSLCDAYGGSEFLRVFQEWQQAGTPRDVHGFIRWRANLGPNSKQWDQLDRWKD